MDREWLNISWECQCNSCSKYTMFKLNHSVLIDELCTGHPNLRDLSVLKGYEKYIMISLEKKCSGYILVYRHII